MIATIIIVSLAFVYLLIETDFLRVHLLIGKDKPPKYARYKVYNSLSRKQGSFLRDGNNYPEGYSPNGEPEYTVILNPGVNDVLCGWDWLDIHCASMVDYHPEVYLHIGGVRYTMTIKQPAIIKDVMRANKLNKKQREVYAISPVEQKQPNRNIILKLLPAWIIK